MFCIWEWRTFNQSEISNISLRKEFPYFTFIWSIFYRVRAEYGDLPNADTFYQLFLELQNYRLFPTGVWLFKVYNENLRTLREICSKLTIKNLEQQINVIDIILISFVLTLNRFHRMFWYFSCQLWTSQGQQVYL